MTGISADEIRQFPSDLVTRGPVITVEDAARINVGITLTVSPNTPIQPIIGGTVHRFSNDPDNVTGFGRFVETRHEHRYLFKGREVTTEFYILYANLDQVNVQPNQAVGGGQQIGTVRGRSSQFWPENELMLAVYTRTDAPILRLWSGGDPLEVAGVLWWNPVFLLGNQ